MESVDFRGWIPAVSGRLSFSVFGSSRHPNKCISAHAADKSRRYMAICQERTTSDVLVPFKRHLSGYLYKIDGNFTYVLIAKTEDGVTDQEKLSGYVFIFRNSEDWSLQVIWRVREYCDLLNNYIKTGRGNLSDYMGHKFDLIVQDLTDACSVKASFTVHRTGVTDISIDKSDCGGNFSTTIRENKFDPSVLYQVVGSQIFYFLKDIGHKHQHHSPSTDTIVNAHLKGDDIFWRLDTLYSIYRKVIEYKRNPDLNTFNDTLGLIAYAKAFKIICDTQLSNNKKWNSMTSVPLYMEEEMSMSIKSSQAKWERDHKESQEASDKYRNITISIIGLVLTFTGLLSLVKYEYEISNDHPLIYLLDFIMNNTYLCVFSMAIFILFSTGVAYCRALTRGFVINTVRFLNWMPRWQSIVFLCISGSAVMLLSYFLLHIFLSI